MKISSTKIAKMCDAEISGSAEITITDLLIDSRKISAVNKDTLFIALRGEKNDGHRYIVDMYSAGIRVFLLEAEYFTTELRSYTEAVFIIVSDTLIALHKLAAWKRSVFNGRVISVSGSNGKTIIKEWLADSLNNHESVFRSPRSFNSQVGVPLSLWKLNNSYLSAVIEAGMSHPGEIAKLEKIIKPEIGIFSHIGDAHQENFSSISEKIKEKLSLFINSEVLIYPMDKKDIHKCIMNDSRFNMKKLFSWSEKNDQADVIIRAIDKTRTGTDLSVRYGKHSFVCKFGLSDRASIDNASTVIATLLFFGFNGEAIMKSIVKLQPVAMRMEQKEGINNCLLLEDFYNSDPGSLYIALEHLSSISGDKLTLILSDFIQSGIRKEELYREVAKRAKTAGVNRIIGIGNDLVSCKEYFNCEKEFFSHTDDFINWYSSSFFSDEAILIKGARKFKFEKIARLLELKTHITQLEINFNSVLTNLNSFKKILRKDTAIMAIVKAFAYGAGPKEISEWLTYNGVDFLAVAYVDEGVNLRKYGIKCRIMVMNPDPDSFRLMLDNELEPEIYNILTLNRFVAEAKKSGSDLYPVHIKLDTGMHRLGFMDNEMEQLAEIINSTSSIKVASVFSHLAAADDKAYDKLSKMQAQRYIAMTDYLSSVCGAPFIRHLLNSAGIIRFPEYQFDMVRIGIGLYGISDPGQPGLIQVPGFYSRISQIKTVVAGDGIGYGFTDVSDKDRRIAIIPVGYADGLKRKMGEGRGRVFINNNYVQISGRICMDMCMVDVTGINASEGDRVEIFGRNISIKEVADICETIPYEILTDIPPRVKRVYLYE